MPRSAEQTRKQILDGAYRLFRRRGYSRVTMNDIASEARFTKRTLYHHFKSKDDLYIAVLEDAYERLAESRARGLPGPSLGAKSAKLPVGATKSISRCGAPRATAAVK